MDKKDKELDERFWDALIIADLVIKDYKRRDINGEGNEFIKMLEASRETFRNLHEQWRHLCGSPVVLDATTLAKFLHSVANDIERKATPYCF